MGRNKFFNKIIATAQSLAADFQTDPIITNGVDQVNFTIVMASISDNTGVFSVQHRKYVDANQYSTWITLEVATALDNSNSNGAGVTAAKIFNLQQVPPGQLRVAFVAAGGTPDGTAEIAVSAKSQGA